MRSHLKIFFTYKLKLKFTKSVIIATQGFLVEMLIYSALYQVEGKTVYQLFLIFFFSSSIINHAFEQATTMEVQLSKCYIGIIEGKF